MPSSYTTSLRFEKQFTGENVNTWGDRLNTALDRVDSAIAGISSIALTGDTTLTSSNTSADQARSAVLKFTGTPSATATVTIPSVSKSYLAWNATNKIVTLTTGSGSVVQLDPSDKVTLFCDGTNVFELGYNGVGLKAYIASAILTGTGSLPTVAGNAAKYLHTDGSNAYWKAPNTSELTDIASYRHTERAFAVAMAVAF